MRFLIETPWSKKIRSWRTFARIVRAGDTDLLGQLPRFADSILVAGCQRSGTTIVARTIARSDAIRQYRFTHDDELDAALILSGRVEHPAVGRHCFQTTYLNERYFEYWTTSADYRLIWVLRNPHSVVFSMVHNWKMFALDELFMSCGVSAMPRARLDDLGSRGLLQIPPIEKACYSYAAKTAQLFELKQRLPQQTIMVIEYDRLCSSPVETLQQVYRFIDLPFRDRYAEHLSRASMSKSDLLSECDRKKVDSICAALYQDAVIHAAV